MHRGHLDDSPECPCPAPRAREIIEPINEFHHSLAGEAIGPALPTPPPLKDIEPLLEEYQLLRRPDTGCLAARERTVVIGTEDGVSPCRAMPMNAGTRSRRGSRRCGL